MKDFVRAWMVCLALCLVCAGQEQKPVLLYLPGLKRSVSDYSSIAQKLRSAGYEVIGVQPQRNNAVEDQDSWVEDLLAAKNKVGKGRRVGVWGHSLGGAASIGAAARDAEILAAANLDGDFMGSMREARPKQAVLLVSNGESLRADASFLERSGWERSETRRTADWAAVSSLAAYRLRLRFPGTGHMNFSDLALAGMKDPRRFGAAEPKQVLERVGALLQAFFDEHLRGQRGATKKAIDGLVTLD